LLEFLDTKRDTTVKESLVYEKNQAEWRHNMSSR
jgi:hypothetical protein